MKNIIKLIIGLLLVIPLHGQTLKIAKYNSASDQNLNSECLKKMSKAQNYLNGLFLPFDTIKAFNLFMECAQAGVPKAMNAVGILCSKGYGNLDREEAITWFKRAGDLGYPQAWFNLGELYKFGYGVPQDFGKAYESFKKAADMNYPSGWYAQGYMLFKGLGCKQDYQQAYELFQKGSQVGSLSCMYMLGLCLRNGFGTNRDTALAMHWLRKSAAGGYKYAPAEVASSEPEYKAADIRLKSLKTSDGNTPVTFQRVKHNLPKSDISGVYTGFLITYDWSGQKIISQSPLKLELEFNEKQVNGNWFEGDSLSAIISGTLTDTSLVFTNAGYRRPEHYHPVKPLLWQFQSAALELVKNEANVYLSGNVRFYLPELMEPSRQMYVSLYKNDNSITQQNVIKKDLNNTEIKDFVVFPNPFSHKLNISFYLETNCNVIVEIYAMDGNLELKLPLGILSAGKQVIPLEVDIPVGPHIVKALVGSKISKSIIVKQ